MATQNENKSINEIKETLAVLANQVNGISKTQDKLVDLVAHITTIQETNKTRDEKLKDHEDRIREVESTVAKSTGVVKFGQWIIPVVVSGALFILAKLFGGK